MLPPADSRPSRQPGAAGAGGFPPVPDALRSRNVLRYLPFYGPGAILASVTIGTGETVFASRGGAIFGYSLLWCLAWGAFFKAVQSYAGLRFVVLSGRHPAIYWADLPGPRGWFPASMALMSTITLATIVSALPKALATLLASLLGMAPTTPGYTVTVNTIACACLVVCALAALGSSYRVLEAAQTAIVLLFVGLILAAFLALRPDPAAILRSFLVPVLPEYPDWVREQYPTIARRTPWVEVMTYIGMIGGSAADYIAYLSFARDKRWGRAGATMDEGASLAAAPTPEDVAAGRLWLRAPLTDVTLSFSVLVLITAVFFILGAHVLTPARLVPHESTILSVQARFLTDVHPRLFPLYVAGIIAVFGGTLYGAFEMQARALGECWRSLRPDREPPSTATFRRALVGIGMTSGVTLIWTNLDPVAIITPASLFAGVFACGLWCFAMLWTDARYLPPVFRMGRLMRALLVVAGIVMTGVGLRAMFDYARSWL